MAITKIIANTPQTPNNSDAQDWASMLNAIVGDISGVLTYGNELEVEIVNDNKIKVKDGVYSLQGHMIRNHEGTDLELTVNSGTLGVKRIDLLVVTYEKNINNQQDDVFEFEIVQGEAIASNDGNPTPPSITQNDLLEGGTKRQEVLYELHLDETTLSLVDKRQFVTSVHELENRIENGFNDVSNTFAHSLNKMSSLFSGDLNFNLSEKTESGYFFSDISVENRPFNYAIVIYVRVDSTNAIQMAFELAGNQRFAHRSHSNNGWGSWKILTP